MQSITDIHTHMKIWLLHFIKNVKDVKDKKVKIKLAQKLADT